MRKIISIIISVVILMSCAAVMVNAATFNYSPDERVELYKKNGIDAGEVAATLRANDVYYAGMNCFTVSNDIKYEDNVSVRNIAAYIGWVIEYTDATYATDEVIYVATESRDIRMYPVYPALYGRTISHIDVYHTLNETWRDSHLDAYTTVTITASYDVN